MIVKKVPLRKCVVSGEILPKNELIRIVCNKDGVVSVDTTSKANGRGAYLKLSKDVIALAKKKNALSRSLKVSIPDEIYTMLESMCDE